MEHQQIRHAVQSQQTGSSLVMALVAAAIVAIVALGVATMFNDSLVAQNQVDNRMSLQTLRLSMIERLSDRGTCAASLAGRNPLTGAGPAITQIVNALGTVLFETSAPGGVTYENNRLRIVRFFFQTVPTNTFRPFAIGGREGSLDLFVEVAPVNAGAGGLQSYSLAVRLIANLDATDNLATCIAIGNDSDDIWRLNAAGEIFYNGGNVGIGTNNPAFALHVVGKVLLTGSLAVSERIDAPLIFTTGTAGSIVAEEMRADRFLYTSDRRLKQDIHKISGPEDLYRLRGVEFRWKDSGRKSMGFIAQEIEKIFSDMVWTDRNSGEKSVDYSQLVPLMVEALKQIEQQNRALAEQVDQLEATCKP